MYNTVAILCFYLLPLCMGCNSVTPEKCFDIAVLNSNMLVGFANEGQIRELESPSVKMSENGNGTVAMSRSDLVQAKVDFVEANLKKLKGLKETEDQKEMVQASLALHEYILPVYKTEYQQLARYMTKVLQKKAYNSSHRPYMIDTHLSSMTFIIS